MFKVRGKGFIMVGTDVQFLIFNTYGMCVNYMPLALTWIYVDVIITADGEGMNLSLGPDADNNDV